MDYYEYNRIVNNLKNINVTYGENIDITSDFDKLVSNAFNSLDVSAVLEPLEDNCLFINCFGRVSSYKLNADILSSAFRNVYGVDRNIELKDFKFNNADYKGECILNKSQNNYICSLTDSNEKYADINYKIVSANYLDDDTILVKAYAYFMDEECDSTGKVCLYADRKLLNRIVKCKKSEIDDYLTSFNLLDIVYKKNSNNEYYIDSLQW